MVAPTVRLAEDGGVVKIIVEESAECFYQYPVVTEKACIGMPTRGTEIFVHAPWATVLDRWKGRLSEPLRHSLSRAIQQAKQAHPDHTVATAAQHINFRQLAVAWCGLGVQRVYASQRRRGEQTLAGLELRPLPLYPVNVWDAERRAGLRDVDWPQRRYLYSFVGAAKRNDLHPIRKRLLTAAWRSTEGNSYVWPTGQWHFERLVYGVQAKGGHQGAPTKAEAEQTERYNEALSQSKFSLCPIGSGPNTIRLWESLAVGAVPIVIAEQFDVASCLPPDTPAASVCVELTYDHPSLRSPAALRGFLNTLDGAELSRAGMALMARWKADGWFQQIP